MNDKDESLDLLDLEDDSDIGCLPESSPFAAPRPKKPWLLLGIGLIVIALATYIIIRTIGSDSNSSVDIDLDTPPVETVDPNAGVPSDTLVVPPQHPTQPVVVAPTTVKPVQPTTTAPVQPTNGVPVREVRDRATVTFNPDKPVTTKPVAAAPTVKPVAKPVAKPKTSAAVAGSWYVQFGSYSTRALAESAQKKIAAKHSGLFAGKQFVVLAAVLPNGTTTYRLRIAFADSNDANGFCRNAKSDGLDCYVAR